MTKSFKNLINKMPKERREKIEERAQEILFYSLKPRPLDVVRELRLCH